MMNLAIALLVLSSGLDSGGTPEVAPSTAIEGEPSNSETITPVPAAHDETAPLVQAEVTPTSIPSRRPFRLLDVSAEVLAPRDWEVGVIWGRLARGILPRFQLSTHAAPWLLSGINLNARVLLLDDERLRVAVDVGGAWVVLARLGQITAATVPVEVRASVPLPWNLEMTFTTKASWVLLHAGQVDIDVVLVSELLSLVRYDSRGAWLFQAQLPLTTIGRIQTSQYGGSLAGFAFFDDVPAWSVLLARDLQLGEKTHLRFGLGYRNRPGILFLQSLGPVLLSLDLYWRF
jgi:hypothetical protein